MKFDPEFLAGLKAKAACVSVTDQEISVPMNTGAEFGLPTPGTLAATG